jgi:hypothetical protein
MAVMDRHQVVARAADAVFARRVGLVGQRDQRGAALFGILIAAAKGGRGIFQIKPGVKVQRHGAP